MGVASRGNAQNTQVTQLASSMPATA